VQCRLCATGFFLDYVLGGGHSILRPGDYLFFVHYAIRRPGDYEFLWTIQFDAPKDFCFLGHSARGAPASLLPQTASEDFDLGESKGAGMGC
jgi:hypothetical protein